MENENINKKRKLNTYNEKEKEEDYIQVFDI